MVNNLLLIGLGFAAGYLQAVFTHSPKTWAKIMESIYKLQDAAQDIQEWKKKRKGKNKDSDTDNDGYIRIPPT